MGKSAWDQHVDDVLEMLSLDKQKREEEYSKAVRRWEEAYNSLLRGLRSMQLDG